MQVFPCNITANGIRRPLISHCYGNIWGRISATCEQVKLYYLKYNNTTELLNIPYYKSANNKAFPCNITVIMIYAEF